MLHEAPFEAQDIRASDFFSLISGHSLSERITPAHSPPLPGRAYEGEKWSARLKNRLTAPPCAGAKIEEAENGGVASKGRGGAGGGKKHNFVLRQRRNGERGRRTGEREREGRRGGRRPSVGLGSVVSPSGLSLIPLPIGPTAIMLQPRNRTKRAGGPSPLRPSRPPPARDERSS